MSIKSVPKQPSKREISEIVERGSSPAKVKNIVIEELQKELNFPMKIKGENAEAMERARNKANLSRRSWIELAIREKLERDGEL